MIFAITAFDAPSGDLGFAVAGTDLDRIHAAARRATWILIAPSDTVRDGLSIAQILPGLIESGEEPGACKAAVREHPSRDAVQLLVVDSRGRTAAHTGRACDRLFGHTEGTGHVAAGQGLSSPNIIGAMSLSFERSEGDSLAERLLLALESGGRAGGAGAADAAMLTVARSHGGATLTARIDHDEDPIALLRQRVAAVDERLR